MTSAWTVTSPDNGRKPSPDPSDDRTLTTLDYARWYVRHGISVIPVQADGSKAPALKAGQVQPYRERFATEDELAAWFAPNKAVGIGLVCGKQSGNLVVLDFETAFVWDAWLARVTAAGGFLKAAVGVSPIVRTPSGGRHVYCRIREHYMAGKVFARTANGKNVLIETRGQGHYVLAPGCPPACHENNIAYTWESKGWLARD